MTPIRAIHIKTLAVEDPDSKGSVEIEVYKDPVAGSIFAVDASFLDQVSVFIPSIFNSGTLQLEEEDDPDEGSSSRRLPTSTWPGGDDSAEETTYGVTITVDVSAPSFHEAKQAFLKSIALGAADAAIFHIEHLRSGIVRELD